MSGFSSFAVHEVAVGEATIFARVGGSGPPLLLLHGYPQSHLMWARVAERLAARFTVVAADLRGYGRSSAPPSERGERYSKRVMAKDALALMAALGHETFAVAGHDRGGRVAYRMALDHPDRVTKIATLDIVPTAEMWAGMDAARAMTVYHWMFLAQPEPLPEMLIAGAPDAYLDHTLKSWTADQSLKSFAPEALAAYRAAIHEAERRHAMCEDYRAGATIDRALDEADRAAGRRIAAPLLALWGATRHSGQGRKPAGSLAALGRRRQRARPGRRPFPARGSGGRDGGGAARLLLGRRARNRSCYVLIRALGSADDEAPAAGRAARDRRRAGVCAALQRPQARQRFRRHDGRNRRQATRRTPRALRLRHPAQAAAPRQRTEAVTLIPLRLGASPRLRYQRGAQAVGRGRMRILVTGGAGFIGSAVVRRIISETPHEVLVFDKLTYAGNLASLAPVAGDPRYAFVRGDICDARRRRRGACGRSARTGS